MKVTDKEKRSFLRAEGWRVQRMSLDKDLSYLIFWDPIKGHGFSLKYAYALALKRKSQREARRLRKAGFEWSPGCPGIEAPGWSKKRTPEEHFKHSIDFWRGKVPLDQIMTRSEAVKLLDSSRGKG